jgi:hypothetical protein
MDQEGAGNTRQRPKRVAESQKRQVGGSRHVLGKVISNEKSFIHGQNMCMSKARFSQSSMGGADRGEAAVNLPLKEKRCWQSDSFTREISERGV